MDLQTEEKLLIIHADDFGMSHSVNEAIFSAFEQGVISSASIMPPCPWFWEAADFVVKREDLDIGVHLTFTSEWDTYRWRPLSSQTRAYGLVDQSGAFHKTSQAIFASEEIVAAEIVGQFTLCRQCGISPSHLDSHMFALFDATRVRSYVTTAEFLGIKCLLPRFLNGKPRRSSQCGPEVARVDNLIYATAELTASSWEKFYIEQLDNLKPGINQLLVHPGMNDVELNAITGAAASWGADWRQRDYDVLTSEIFKEALERNSIKVICWRDLSEMVAAATNLDTVDL